MQKSDFQIRLDGNTLIIASSKEHSDEDKQENYSRKEFSYQSFERSLLLSKDAVDEEGISAKYENELLQLRIPKKEAAMEKEPRMFEIG